MSVHLLLRRKRETKRNLGGAAVDEAAMQAMVKSVGSTFDMFDQDGDKNIDREEFGELLAHLGAPVPDEELDEVISRFDTDNDGRIDVKEFVKVITDQEKAVVAAFQVFDPLDTGVVTVKEFWDMMTEYNEVFSEEEISKMLDAAGVTPDGQIDYRAFAKSICYHDAKAGGLL